MMNLNIDKSAINKKLQIVPAESHEKAMQWPSSDISNDFSKPYKRIKPVPGACIKTWTASGDKVFINICHSNELHAPEDISDNEFCQLMSDDTPGFVIPMAIELEKMVKDKGGVEKAKYDVLINSKYFEKCMNKPHFWKFTITAIIESINDKYMKSLDASKYIVLKNRKVMGSLDVFTIEDRLPKKPVIKKPLIEEINTKENKESSNTKESIESINVKPNPKIVEMETEKSSATKICTTKDQNYIFLQLRDQDIIFGYFYLPLSNITDITVDVGESRIIVENQKTDTIIDSFLPCTINNKNVTANYDSILHVLRLRLPLKMK